MKAWILSIVVTALLSTIILLILPNGKTAKVVKSMLAFLTLLVIIKPILELDVNKIDVDGLFNDSNITYQNEYIDFVENEQKNNYVKKINLLLNNIGINIDESELNIITERTSNGVLNIEKITINLQNAVITPENEHININEEIVKTVSDYFGIESEKVEIYERKS